VTKDRPRNRPGNGHKSGGFPGGDTRKAWQRERGADRARPEREQSREGGSGKDDKPRQPARGGAPSKFSGKPLRGGRPDKQRDGKPKEGKPRDAQFRGGERDGAKAWSGGDRHPEGKPRRFEKPRGEFQKPVEDRDAGDGPRREFRGKPDRFRDGRRDHHRGPKRDGQKREGPGRDGKWERREASFEEHGEVWIWGVHAAAAALANPNRKISKLLTSPNAAIRAGLDPNALPAFAEIVEPKELDFRLAEGAVHQGIAVRCAQIDGPDISDAAMRPGKPLVILDQVTDPQNVGAIYRSAAAFGIAGVVMQTRNSPLLGGALAKAAAGAIEIVDDIRAVNISRAIDELTDAGWRVIGLDGSAEQTLEEAFAGPEPLAIVMGAEGRGIRQGVAKACTGMARIPMGEGMESLNVSNAAAIAFYEAQRRHGAAPPPAKAAVPAAEDDAADQDADDIEYD
jgi:23S rRNA (guanosine2251-2'-O)-methyltransferase